MSQTNMNCQAGSITLGLGSRSRVPKRFKTCTSVKLTLQKLHREINRFQKLDFAPEKRQAFSRFCIKIRIDIAKVIAIIIAFGSDIPDLL